MIPEAGRPLRRNRTSSDPRSRTRSGRRHPRTVERLARRRRRVGWPPRDGRRDARVEPPGDPPAHERDATARGADASPPKKETEPCGEFLHDVLLVARRPARRPPNYTAFASNRASLSTDRSGLLACSRGLPGIRFAANGVPAGFALRWVFVPSRLRRLPFAPGGSARVWLVVSLHSGTLARANGALVKPRARA